MKYVFLIGLLLGLPLFYWLLLLWYKPDFEEEKNKNHMIFCSISELVVLLVSEAALIKIWYDYSTQQKSLIMILLLAVSLAAMTVLCMTDYWEKVVPNKILLMWIVIGGIIAGMFCIRDMSIVTQIVPSMTLGVIFCVIVFGLTYLLGRGGLGSGDVKLSIVMGLFMTGEYVVGAIFYGCLISAAYSIIQLCRKKVTRKHEMPFVPFLYIGTIIIYFVG